MKEPQWLIWARELRAIAQSGLAYTESKYERDRYQQITHIADKIMATYTETDEKIIKNLFAIEAGYATPKIEVRAAVFDDQQRILMVKETQDNKWSLPGGWADVNLTPKENTIKEVKEESGFDVEIVKLAAVWDRSHQHHPAGLFSCYKMFFICHLTGGQPSLSIETSEVGWFTEDALPEPLSLARVLPKQIKRMFEHQENILLPTDID